MSQHISPASGTNRRLFWIGGLFICAVWIAVLMMAISRLSGSGRVLVAILVGLPLIGTFLVYLGYSWNRRQGLGAAGLTGVPGSGGKTHGLPGSPADHHVPSPGGQAVASMTRSGLFDTPPPIDLSNPDVALSGNFSIVDMVNRLDPVGFRWIESSLAEQEFLGWSLAELQRKSFLDIVCPDDRQRSLDALRTAVLKGECLGLVIRIKTAQGKTKAIEVNAGARYKPNHEVSYLRCHISDVTVKVHAERELRLRSRELTQLNEQLRRINRELEELKDRYTDLYENAPAMYFSLDLGGRLIECNQTFLTTLNRSREEVIGQGFDRFLEGADLERCVNLFAQLLEQGSIETESRWVRAGGEPIDVWISGRAIRGAKGNVEQTRCVAQDVTAKHLLEAQLYEKNRSLAHANAELSRKNRELDEFVYVVSHDLQEPLRTLSAFSGYLLQDHSHQLDTEGRGVVNRLVDASHRMRSMIQALMNLSRAGRVTGEFEPVRLGDLCADLRADLGELIRSRNAALCVHGPNFTLSGDRRRLLQLLTNLVSNGIKYNASAVPRVEIGSAVGTDQPSSDPGSSNSLLTIFVKDNGIGIDARHHQRIFQPFRRLHSQDEYEGTGVGLAICTKIAQAHGGRLWVESVPEQGSTFFVSLPSAAALEKPVEPPGER